MEIVFVVQKLLTSPPHPLRLLFKQTTRDGAGAAPDTAAAAFAGDAARDPTRDPIRTSDDICDAVQQRMGSAQLSTTIWG